MTEQTPATVDLTDDELEKLDRAVAQAFGPAQDLTNGELGQMEDAAKRGDLLRRLIAEIRRRRADAPKGTAHAVTLSEDIGVKPT